MCLLGLGLGYRPRVVRMSWQYPDNNTTTTLAAIPQCLPNVLASLARQTTNSTQQTTSPPRTTSSANHNKACRRTTRLNGDNEERRGRHGARHGYLRQDRRIVELQYSCNCCIETSLTHTLTCPVCQRLLRQHLFGHSCLVSST